MEPAAAETIGFRGAVEYRAGRTGRAGRAGPLRVPIANRRLAGRHSKSPGVLQLTTPDAALLMHETGRSCWFPSSMLVPWRQALATSSSPAGRPTDRPTPALR